VDDEGAAKRLDEQVADPLALETQICLGLSAAARALVSAYRPVLEPLGLTHPQYLVMLALWQHHELSGRQIADLLHLEPPTLSPLLRRLEQAGLVHRRRSSLDERVVLVTLTDAGRELRTRAEAVPATMVERLGLGRDELDAVLAATALVLRATAGREDRPPEDRTPG
jgi:DNA-binding MarR family transcriptional regulator